MLRVWHISVSHVVQVSASYHYVYWPVGNIFPAGTPFRVRLTPDEGNLPSHHRYISNYVFHSRILYDRVFETRFILPDM